MTLVGSFYTKQINLSIATRFVQLVLLLLSMAMVTPAVHANSGAKVRTSAKSPRTVASNADKIAVGNVYGDFSSQQAFPQSVAILGGMEHLQRQDISSDFGMRNTPGGSKYHEGIDIPSPLGTPILAAGQGKVIYSGFSRGYGNLVVLDHGDGITTRYAHAQQIYVQLGQAVSQSQIIAAVGSTGNARTPHLHFEFRQYQQPLDPVVLLGLSDASERPSYPAMNLVQTKNVRKTPRKLVSNAALNKTSGVLYSHDLKASAEGGLKRKITPKPIYLSKNSSEVRQDPANSRQLTR